MAYWLDITVAVMDISKILSSELHTVYQSLNSEIDSTSADHSVFMDNNINIACTVTAMSDQMASGIFRLASRRLLHVKEWSSLDGSLLSTCQLIDERGKQVDREVHQNDYLMLEDDAESPKWIQIESVEEKTGEGTESTILKARATKSPWSLEEGNPTISRQMRPGIISVVKRGLNITARVYADSPANKFLNVGDRMKYISMAAYSTLGGYRVQWRSLVNAILGDLQDVEKLSV